MSHNSSISGMGEPVPAIRVINKKRMLLIMVGISIMLSCGKEYVKLAWEFICKPGRENLDFLQVKKSEMTGKTKNIICIEVLSILETSEVVLCPISYCRDVFSPYLGKILDFVVVHWSFIFVSHVSGQIVEFI